MTRRNLLVLGLVSALAAAGCGDLRPGVARLGEPVPELDLPALDGGRVTGADLAGDAPVVLNFWATWCGPCVREIPALQELHRGGAARVVSIALDDGGADVVRPFVDAHGIDYPVLLGDVGLLQRFGANAIPFTLILDGDLTVRRIHRSLVTLRTLERDLRRVAEAG